MPATPLFDLIYCLVLEETEESVDRRTEVDGLLASYVPARGGAADRSDRDARAASWGRTPAQQAAMRRARDAATS